jgi:hypothetical protein
VTIARITDAAKFRAMNKAGMDWLTGSGLLAGLQGMGVDMTIDYKAGAREHKGIPIDRAVTTMKQAPDAKPNPLMPNPQPQQVEIAAVDTFGVAVSGNEAGDLMDDVLDRIKEGTPGLDGAAPYKAAVGAAGEKANWVFFLSFNSFLAKVIEEVAKVQPMVAMLAAGIAKPNPAEPPITGSAEFAKFQGGPAVNFSVHVPHQPIQDLAQRVQMMMQQVRPPGGEGEEPPAPKGKAKPPVKGKGKGDDDDF